MQYTKTNVLIIPVHCLLATHSSRADIYFIKGLVSASCCRLLLWPLLVVNYIHITKYSLSVHNSSHLFICTYKQTLFKHMYDIKSLVLIQIKKIDTVIVYSMILALHSPKALAFLLFRVLFFHCLSSS